jgi:hypothetical protein
MKYCVMHVFFVLCVTFLLHALHSHYKHYMIEHALIGFSKSFVGRYHPLTTMLYHALNMLNKHEEFQSCPSTWMLAEFVPHIDPLGQRLLNSSEYPKTIDSVSVCNAMMLSAWIVCFKAGTRPVLSCCQQSFLMEGPESPH